MKQVIFILSLVAFFAASETLQAQQDTTTGKTIGLWLNSTALETAKKIGLEKIESGVYRVQFGSYKKWTGAKGTECEVTGTSLKMSLIPVRLEPKGVPIIFQPQPMIFNRPVYFTPKVVKHMDTTILSCPPPPCCEKPKEWWKKVYLGVGTRSTYDTELIPEDWYVMVGVRHHWRDTMEKGSTYVGAELSLMMAKAKRCATADCVDFIKDKLLKPKARFEIFGGREFGLSPQLGNLKGFIEARYALLQPQVLPELELGSEDKRALPKQSGLTIRAGVRLDIFKGALQLQGAYEYDPIAKLSGGDARVIVSFDAIKKANQKHKTKTKKRAEKMRVEKMRRDTIEAQEFFIENPKPIVLDSTETSVQPTFPGQSDRGINLNLAKLKLWDLSSQNEILRQEVVSNPAKLDELKENEKELKKQREKVARLQKRANK